MNYRSLLFLMTACSTLLNAMDYKESENQKKKMINEGAQLVTQAITHVHQLKHTDNWIILTNLTKGVDIICSKLHHTQGIEAHPNEVKQVILAKAKFDAAVRIKSDGAYSVLRSRIEKKEFASIANIAFQTTFASNYLAEYTEDLTSKEALLRKAWIALCLYSTAVAKQNKYNSLHSQTATDYALLSHVTEELIKKNFDKFDWTEQHTLENNDLNITYYTPAPKNTNASAPREGRIAKLMRKLTQPKIETLESKKEENNNNNLKKSLSLDGMNKFAKK